MKKLEMKQMEYLQGGYDHAKCMMAVGLGAVMGGMVFGAAGFVINGAWNYYMNPACN